MAETETSCEFTKGRLHIGTMKEYILNINYYSCGCAKYGTESVSKRSEADFTAQNCHPKKSSAGIKRKLKTFAQKITIGKNIRKYLCGLHSRTDSFKEPVQESVIEELNTTDPSLHFVNDIPFDNHRHTRHIDPETGNEYKNESSVGNANQRPYASCSTCPTAMHSSTLQDTHLNRTTNTCATIKSKKENAQRFKDCSNSNVKTYCVRSEDARDMFKNQEDVLQVQQLAKRRGAHSRDPRDSQSVSYSNPNGKALVKQGHTKTENRTLLTIENKDNDTSNNNKSKYCAVVTENNCDGFICGKQERKYGIKGREDIKGKQCSGLCTSTSIFTNASDEETGLKSVLNVETEGQEEMTILKLPQPSYNRDETEAKGLGQQLKNLADSEGESSSESTVPTGYPWNTISSGTVRQLTEDFITSDVSKKESNPDCFDNFHQKTEAELTEIKTDKSYVTDSLNEAENCNYSNSSQKYENRQEVKGEGEDNESHEAAMEICENGLNEWTELQNSRKIYNFCRQEAVENEEESYVEINQNNEEEEKEGDGNEIIKHDHFKSLANSTIRDKQIPVTQHLMKLTKKKRSDGIKNSGLKLGVQVEVRDTDVACFEKSTNSNKARNRKRNLSFLSEQFIQIGNKRRRLLLESTDSSIDLDVLGVSDPLHCTLSSADTGDKTCSLVQKYFVKNSAGCAVCHADTKSCGKKKIVDASNSLADSSILVVHSNEDEKITDSNILYETNLRKTQSLEILPEYCKHDVACNLQFNDDISHRRFYSLSVCYAENEVRTNSHTELLGRMCAKVSSEVYVEKSWNNKCLILRYVPEEDPGKKSKPESQSITDDYNMPVSKTLRLDENLPNFKEQLGDADITEESYDFSKSVYPEISVQNGERRFCKKKSSTREGKIAPHRRKKKKHYKHAPKPDIRSLEPAYFLCSSKSKKKCFLQKSTRAKLRHSCTGKSYKDKEELKSRQELSQTTVDSGLGSSTISNKSLLFKVGINTSYTNWLLESYLESNTNNCGNDLRKRLCQRRSAKERRRNLRIVIRKSVTKKLRKCLKYYIANEGRRVAKSVAREIHLDHHFQFVFGLGSYFDRFNNGPPPTTRERMQYEWLRLETFRNYTGNGNALALARNGFYHDHTGPTTTRCYLCDARHSSWEMFDDVNAEHRRQSPNCPFHENSGQESVNISITSGDSEGGATVQARTSAPTVTSVNTTVTASSSSAAASEAMRSLQIDQASSSGGESISQQPTEDPESRDRSLLALSQPRTQRALGRTGHSYSTIIAPRRNNVATGARSNVGIDPLGNGSTTSSTGSQVPGIRPSSILGGPVGAGAFTGLNRTGQNTDAQPSVSRATEGLQQSIAPSSSTEAAAGTRQTNPAPGAGGRTDPTITVVVDNPKHPDYVNIDSRVSSYQGWPDYLDQTPRQMSEAGFFFVGVADFTRCFCCGGGLRNWEPELKGERYVGAVQRRHQEHMAEQQRQQIEIAQRRDENRNPPDPMTTEAAAVMREMGYSAERTREAILAVRRQTGSAMVTTQQVLTWLLDDEERPLTGNSSNTELGIRPPPMSSSTATSIVDTSTPSSIVYTGTSISSSIVYTGTSIDTSIVNTTSSISTATSIVSAGTNTSTVSSTSTTATAEVQQTGTPAGAESSGTGNQQTGSGNSSSSNAASGASVEKQSGASGGDSDESKSAAKEDASSREPTNKSTKRKNATKKAKNKAAAKSETAGATGGDIDAKSLKAENEKLREMQTCKICMQRAVNTTLLPCGHLVCCDTCAARLQRCPICRKRIKGTVKTFMS
ncbi:uncharacterized protein LOC123552973 [Mercenaria mercenaria]|uniref:uncharacterized protein LOC123552973 n=1 Tax=Mercenaria mercenaria TaxID=6596 RepID=UPI00234F06B6|nr:uncharacterized protein LOC123552973 [Mercenaria mercenaria]